MSYVDTKLVNCNRLASVEARSGNDSNPAVFTNPLNETVRLNVGDKISVEKAFISEVGAGNSQTIEFKGVSTGTNKVGEYTKIEYLSKYYKKTNSYNPKYRVGYYRRVRSTVVADDTVELKDNLAPLILGYYITSNEYPNYIQQPRRFAQTNDTRNSVPRLDVANHYTNKDGFTEGMTAHTVSLDCLAKADWIKKPSVVGGEFIYKQKVDNTRYTLFIKDKIAYSVLAGFDAEDRDDIATFPSHTHNGIIQEAIYNRYRERVDIKVGEGFNTPSAIADQITQQLTEIRGENIFEILDNQGFVRSITKTIETNTYKPINCQNLYNFNSGTLTSYGNQVLPATAANIDQDALDYVATFGYIGVKRPEIFEAGRKMMNELMPNSITMYPFGGGEGNQTVQAYPDRPFEGFATVGSTQVTKTRLSNDLSLIKINVEYTEENLKIIRDFLDTQTLYPELWDNLDEQSNYDGTAVPIPGGLALPTIENSRFFHINKYTTDTGSSPHAETFGDDVFIQRTAPNNGNFASVPLFFEYIDSDRDKFINQHNWYSIAETGLSYGFAIPLQNDYHTVDGTFVKAHVIGLALQRVGGVPVSLYTDTTTSETHNILSENTRIGYDFHSSAFSTAIITPYAGYSNVDIGTEATSKDGKAGSSVPHSFSDTCFHIHPLTSEAETTDIMPYMTQTYIGANNPLISYNNVNNRFELARLHTSNNIGNNARGGNAATSLTSTSMEPPAKDDLRKIVPPTKNAEANSTVYKINPRPPQFGYSPTFKPYTRYNFSKRVNVYPENASEHHANFASSGGNTQAYEAWNDNIIPYEVFDSHGGVYIDNWGFDKSNWEDSLWDILGFDYNAVNATASSSNVLTKRVDNENSNSLYRPTTNAEVVQTDTKIYVNNQYGAPMYYTSLPYPISVINYKTNDTPDWQYSAGDTFTAVSADPLELFGRSDVITKSTTITATDLQKSMLRPYYTIRSNILEGASAIGGNPTGSNLPIISIVDKYSAKGDYFLGNPSGIEFTITKPTMLADITTSIHDSDGRYANVDKTSAVIYKISKVKRAPVDIIDEILKPKGKKK